MVNATEAFELSVRALRDTLPLQQADAAYLFCQTKDNEASVLSAAKRLLHESLARKVLFLGSNAKSGYPGYEEWRKKLLNRDVSEHLIEAVPIEETHLINTLVESEALIRFAVSQSYKSLFVAAPAFHQPRALMTVVTVALKAQAKLLIYSYTGDALPWNERATHSQGALESTRHGLIRSEWERILKYQEMGDLATFHQVLAYLNERDSLSAKNKLE